MLAARVAGADSAQQVQSNGAWRIDSDCVNGRMLRTSGRRFQDEGGPPLAGAGQPLQLAKLQIALMTHTR